MKMKVKILNESKAMLKESYMGLYDQVGVQPGSLDLFLKHFVEGNLEDVGLRVYEFIKDTYGSRIEALTDADIPRTSARGRGTPLQKVKNGLYWGHTHWWNQIFGPAAADGIIEMKALLYMMDLTEGLERIGYSTITPEQFAALPAQDQNLVYEKHFIEDYLDNFFDQHVKMSSMNNTGFLDNPGVGAGLYGQMKDWYMSTDGADVLKQKIKELLPLLPQREV